MRLTPFPGGNKVLRSDGEWIDPPAGSGQTAWDTITDKPATFPSAAHNHDASYAATGHNHDAAYAPVTHGHDYAATNHNHDGAYAAAGHNHDGAYAAAGHNHAGVYEPANANIQVHVAQAHAPSNAQKNSDITKAEIEAKLTGEISSHTHAGGGGGPAVKSGVVNLGAGASVVVTFGTAFPVGVTPHVVVCSQFNGSDTSTTLFAHTVTNLGFTMKGAGNAAGNVAWIATSAGNA